MALSKPDSCIKIGEETFDLISIPSAESRMVQSAKREFLEQLDLHSLADDLGKLGKFMRLAYNGVAGHTELQIKVQRVGYKITKLADKSATTVYQFKETSQDVLEELQTTYQFLLEGLENAAVISLSMMADKAAGMAEAAEELRNDFDQAKDDVISALEDTQTAKGDQEKMKKSLDEEREEFEKKKKQAEELKEIARKAEEEAEELYKQAQAREEKAQEVHDSIQKQEILKSTLRSVADSITGVFEGVTSAVGLALIKGLEEAAEKLKEIGDKAGYKKAIERAHREKMMYFEQMKKERDQRREAIQQCIECTQKIISCQNDSDLAEVAIDALHNSVGALKCLSATMMQASRFWEMMQIQCKQLARGEIKDKVEKMIEMPQELRLKVWTSTPFKNNALRYYTRWVLLDNLSSVYKLQIQNTSKELYKYLKENPTPEQAKSNVRQMAADLKDDLKQYQEDERLKETQSGSEWTLTLFFFRMKAVMEHRIISFIF